MTINFSILAWKTPWTEGSGGYSPWGRKESDMTEWLSTPTCDAYRNHLSPIVHYPSSWPYSQATGHLPIPSIPPLCQNKPKLLQFYCYSILPSQQRKEHGFCPLCWFICIFLNQSFSISILYRSSLLKMLPIHHVNDNHKPSSYVLIN